MGNTPNLNLNKPESIEYVNVHDLNDNADIIDEAIGELKDGTAVIPDLETTNKTLAGGINENKQTLKTHLAEDTTDAHNISNITGLQTTLDAKESSLNANQKRPIFIQSTAPTNPQEGDIWIEVD